MPVPSPFEEAATRRWPTVLLIYRAVLSADRTLYSAAKNVGLGLLRELSLLTTKSFL